MQVVASVLSMHKGKGCGLSKFWQSIISLRVVRFTIFDLKLTQCSVEMLVVFDFLFPKKLTLQKSILKLFVL